MKRFTALSVLLTTLAAAAPAAYTARNGQATFEHKTLRPAPVLVRGNIAGVTAQAKVDPSALARTTGTVTVPLVNLKTGIALRDDHARSETALHTGKFPNATFQLQGVAAGALVEGQTIVTTGTGRLTLKGVSKTLNVPLKLTLRGGAIEVATQFKFNPHDFGVNYKGASSDSALVNVSFTLTK